MRTFISKKEINEINEIIRRMADQSNGMCYVDYLKTATDMGLNIYIRSELSIILSENCGDIKEAIQAANDLAEKRADNPLTEKLIEAMENGRADMDNDSYLEKNENGEIHLIDGLPEVEVSNPEELRDALKDFTVSLPRPRHA